ncbi:nudC domain-containing protein 1 [Euwallacea fornicatus]|uniref:nudC domain-containing protein 1 n=1 Tax=Euwallacea fornicatus TaxID=995702 RepID=UPI00338F358A
MNATATLELKPDRLLMDSNFNGYKLSLADLKVTRKTLEINVDKTFPKSSQYSLLHAKLFGLHNHLFGDQFDELSSVYFIDQEFKVQKTYIDSTYQELIHPVTVFNIPKLRKQITGDYNVTLKFASPSYAILSDGMGKMYILATKNKQDNEQFETEFSENVLENEKQGFIVSDAVYNEENKEINVLLLHIQQDDTDCFISVVHWLTFKKSQSKNKEKTWGQTALRQLQSKGEIQYLYLEKNGSYINIVSENNVRFILNSEHPIKETLLQPPSGWAETIYTWSQTSAEVTVTVPLTQNPQKNLIQVSANQSIINVTYNSQTLLFGNLEGPIDSSLLTWSLGSDDTLKIMLIKQKEGDWKELIKGDRQGKYIDIAATDHLEKYTTETEVTPQSGTTFNSQQIEECDFEGDKSETFERICGITSKPTHRVHLGSHQVILSPYLNCDWPPALGIRHDVDICLWQPLFEGESFRCKHEGTLLAFGYVQASKTNRKFVTCSPNLSYAVISEASGHIFIYQQNKPLLATNMRHRTTGQKITNIAQQQVFHLPNQDILGLFAANNHLFILGETFILSLNI